MQGPVDREKATCDDMYGEQESEGIAATAGRVRVTVMAVDLSVFTYHRARCGFITVACMNIAYHDRISIHT